MRNGILTASSIAFLLTTLARADIPPPPPDSYTGPQSATLAGLNFEHVASFPSGYVILAHCTKGSPNCTLATKEGALLGVVDKVGGENVGGDVAAIENAFAKAGDAPVTLELILTDQGNRVVSLSVSPH